LRPRRELESDREFLWSQGAKKASDFWEDFLLGKNRLFSGLEAEMGAGAEVMHQVVPLLEPPLHRCVVKSVDVMEEVVAVAPGQVQPATSPKALLEVAVEVPDLVSFRFQLLLDYCCGLVKFYLDHTKSIICSDFLSTTSR
jgi:hypothetical protein